MQDRMFLWLPGKSCYSLPRKVWFIPCIHQTLHLWISIYFILYKILLVEKISIPWKTVKGTWDSSLLKKIKKFREDEIMKLPGKWQKVVEQHSNMLFNKVLGEKEKCVFHFYFKTEGTFRPTQYFQNFLIIPNRNMYPLSYRSPFPLPPILDNLYSFFFKIFTNFYTLFKGIPFTDIQNIDQFPHVVQYTSLSIFHTQQTVHTFHFPTPIMPLPLPMVASLLSVSLSLLLLCHSH